MARWRGGGIPAGVTASLAILVVAPAAAVYWFMTEAAAAQAEAARRRVLQVYRSQLELVRDRIEASWRARIGALDADGIALNPYERAARIGADSLVMFGQPGQPLVYPNMGRPLDVAGIAGPAVANGGSWSRATELEFESGDLPAAAELWGRIADGSRERRPIQSGRRGPKPDSVFNAALTQNRSLFGNAEVVP